MRKVTFAILPLMLFIDGVAAFFAPEYIISDSLFRGSVLIGLSTLLVMVSPWEKP